MQWKMGRRSDNVEDRRGTPLPVRGLQLGGCGFLLLVILAVLLGKNPLKLLGPILDQTAPPEVSTQRPTAPPAPQAYDEQADFASAVLADTEDVWGSLFSRGGATYQPPTLVLFTDMVDSACGMSSAAMGPFYCPGDAKVYLDLGFFHELSTQFGATGDFAQAYVIAHEVGHHVQNVLGISEKVDRLRASADSEEEVNALSVRLELQADCLAGVWAHHAQKQRQLLEAGDVEEGLNAAAAIGDDRIQRMSGRAVSPESWTHGSSKMRVEWFERGMKEGTIDCCNTFKSRPE